MCAERSPVRLNMVFDDERVLLISGRSIRA
jgi:hypothetical protein